MKNTIEKVMASSTSKASEDINESYKKMDIKTVCELESENIKETWEKVTGCSTYEVSSMGRVKALNFQNKGYELIIKPSMIGNRLCFHAVDDNGKHRTIPLAYAVANAFIPNPDKNKSKYVQFKDGNPSNCNVTNLYWSCKRELKSPFVYVYDENGDLLNKFESAIDAAGFFGCSYQAVDSCCRRNGTCQGFRMSYEYMDNETFNKRHNPVGGEKTLPLFNYKTPHKIYGCEDLTISFDPECKRFNKITSGTRSEAVHTKVKRDKKDKIVEASLHLEGFKGKKASVKFVLQKDDSYEIIIDYPNGASLMVAHCKYFFPTQSEVMVCAEALDGLYRKIVSEAEGNVKDVYIDNFQIGRSVKHSAA